MRILAPGFESLGTPVRPQQHSKGCCGKETRKHHETRPKRNEREAANCDPVHEQRDARNDEHYGKHRRQDSLRAAVFQAALPNGSFFVHLEERLVGSGRRRAVLLGHIHRALRFGKLICVFLNAITQ